MSALPIITGKDHPILRAKAKSIPKVTKHIRTLIANMQDTLDSPKVSGVGLAAPQIGESLQIFLAYIGSEKKGSWQVFINPKIVHFSEEKNLDEEGCLSLPKEPWKKVPRANTIIVEYLDEFGKKQSRAFSNFDARVIQHEYDHLQGILYIDYA